MEEFCIVPEILPVVPECPAIVIYPAGDVCMGNYLTPTEVKAEPKVSWPSEQGCLYLLALIDPDFPCPENPTFRSWTLWLVGNIRCNDICGGDTIVEYAGANPQEGSGSHRYIFVVFKQPNPLAFDERIIRKNCAKGREKFKIREFAAKYNLGVPIAGNFFRAEYDDYVPVLNKLLDNCNP